MDGIGKRVVSISILFSLVLSLTSCTKTVSSNTENTGISEEKIEKRTLSVWSIFSDPKSPDGNSKAFYKVLEAVKKEKPHVKVNHEGSQMDSIYKSKIKVASAANELPDIFFIWGAGFAKPFVDSGKVLPVDDYIRKDGTIDKLKPGTYDNFTFEGKVYGIPYSIAVASLYCNKELFSKFDLELPKTWDDLTEAVKVFRANGIAPISLGGKDVWPAMFWNGAITLRIAGAKGSVDILNRKRPFEAPEFIESSKRLAELIELNAFKDNFMGTSYEDSKVYFLSGKAPMYLMGSWANGEIEDESSKVKGKVIALGFPEIPGGIGNSDEFFGGSGETFMISSETQDKETAYEITRYICESMSKEQYLSGSGIPAWKGGYGSIKGTNPLSLQVNDLTESAKSFVYWWDVMLDGKSTQTYFEQLTLFLDGKKTPEQFVEDLQKSITGIAD